LDYYLRESGDVKSLYFDLQFSGNLNGPAGAFEQKLTILNLVIGLRRAIETILLMKAPK